MSDVTRLAKGDLSPADFVTKVAGEINANPALKAAAAWALDALFALVERKLGSSTIAHAIVSLVKAEVDGSPISLPAS